MILDVVDMGHFYIGMLLIPIVICFVFITIGRYKAYKKDNNKKNQFNTFLTITIILAVIMLFLLFYFPKHKPFNNEWRNIQ